MAENQATAKLRNLNISPRKVRLVADSVKGLHVQSALAQLESMPQRSTDALAKLIRSGIANAKGQNMNEDKLVINSIRVDQGIKLKRAVPRARGRATLIEKKMSHVTLELAEKEHASAPAFEVKPKPKKEKKPREEKQTQTPRPKLEEPAAKEKTRRGFGSKIFRRKSV